ncbi:hypothetical protein J6590_093433 [Homalodisca vitripennis]|nr:hypothetical protein J6590_093433 [Homalodisca vitripennis]
MVSEFWNEKCSKTPHHTPTYGQLPLVDIPDLLFMFHERPSRPYRLQLPKHFFIILVINQKNRI